MHIESPRDRQDAWVPGMTDLNLRGRRVTTTGQGNRRPATGTRCSFEGLPQFSALPDHVRPELEACCRTRSYKAGQLVTDDGERPDFIGCVRKGILRMQKTLIDGRQHVVGLLVDGDMFGRVFDGPMHFAIEAATEAEICVFQRGPFESLLQRTPELERLILLNILNELDRARDWMMILANHKVAGRLAGFLMVLCTRFKGVDHLSRDNSGRLTVTIPISRTDLAHLLGTRQESISRAFHALADMGAIAILSPYKVEILAVDILAAEAGEECPEDLRGAAPVSGAVNRSKY